MRNINFIHPVPPHRTQELRRWFIITGGFCVLLICGIGVITFLQWTIYRRTLQEKKELSVKLESYDVVMNSQRKNQEELDHLQQKLTSLESYTNCPKNPFKFLTQIKNALGNLPLESLSIMNHSFELKGLCSTASHATKLINTVQTIPECNSATLISLSMIRTNQLQFIIKGTISSLCSN